MLVRAVRIAMLGIGGVRVGRVVLVVCRVLSLALMLMLSLILILIWVCVSVLIVRHCDSGRFAREQYSTDTVLCCMLYYGALLLHRITRSIKRRVRSNGIKMKITNGPHINKSTISSI